MTLIGLSSLRSKYILFYSKHTISDSSRSVNKSYKHIIIQGNNIKSKKSFMSILIFNILIFDISWQFKDDKSDLISILDKCIEVNI